MRIHAFHVGPCHMRAEAFGHVRSNRQVFYDEQFTMMSGMPLESSLGNCVSRQHSQKFMHSVGASMSHSAAAPTHCSVWDYPAKSFFSLLVHRNDVIKGYLLNLLKSIQQNSKEPSPMSQTPPKLQFCVILFILKRLSHAQQ